MNNSTNLSLLAESDSSLIRAELERLLSSRRFSGARQMSAFLRYTVSETLDGNANRIKAYTVGVDALGKADDFDAQTDPSVRVLALRLRKSLEAAYAVQPECHAVIVMTVGSYVPQFYKPHAIVSDDDSGKLQESGSAAVVSREQVTSGDSAATSVRNDPPDELQSACRRLAVWDEAVSQSRVAGSSHFHLCRPESGEAHVVRMARVSGFNNARLPARFGIIMTVVLLAAAWQVSVQTVRAATVPVGSVAPQSEAGPFSRLAPHAVNSQANTSNTPEVALPRPSGVPLVSSSDSWLLASEPVAEYQNMPG